MFYSQLFVFAVVLAVMLPHGALGHGGDRVVMEPSVSKFTSDAWVQEKGVSSVDYVTCTFVLKLSKASMGLFEDRVLDLSTPSSAAYGSFLTNVQIGQRISPSPAHLQTVLDFLSRYEVNNDNSKGNTVSVNELRTMVHVRMLGSTAEQMLDTQFVQFRSVTERDVSIFRVSRPYSLPAEVAAVVALVDDIVRFPGVAHPLLTYGHQDSGISDEELATQEAVGKLKYNTENPYLHCGNDCYGYTTPALLRELYGVPAEDTVSDHYTGTGLVSFQNKHYDSRNIDRFDEMCGIGRGSAEQTSTVGGDRELRCGLGSCMETTVQMEYARAVAGGLPLTVYYDDNYSLSKWLSWLINTPSAPMVHVLSYVNEDVEQSSPEYMDYVNYHFIIAAARGFSLLYASGDHGVWGRSGLTGTEFRPNFPASAPWVTSVGGSNTVPTAVSNIDVGVTEPLEESAWECSGGGFSGHFPTPKYQAVRVKEYLGRGAYDNSLPPASLYNDTGRGFPDLVAVAGERNPYCVVVRGGRGTIGMSTTSAAVAVVGSLFSALNNARMLAGRAALGFLNPMLYSDDAQACFKDIHDGSENHCHVGSSGQGFRASEGWDPATGFGAVRYDCLSALLV